MNTLFVGSVVERSEESGRLTTDARAYEFDGDGLVEKNHRLQEHSEHLRAKVARYEALLTGYPEDPDLLRLRDRARTEADHVDRRRRMIGTEVANLAARGFVDLAVARGVEAVAVEDLSGLEAGGLGRATNTRVSSSVRGKIVDRLRHAAAREGVRVIDVPARGTSSLCVGCDEKVLRPRYSVSECRRCGISGADRDLVASAKVASRAIAGRVRRSRDGTESVTRAVFEPVRRSRTKIGPTPSQHRTKTLGRRKLARTRTSPLSPSPVPAKARRRPGHASSPTHPSPGVFGQGVSDLGLAGPGAPPALPVLVPWRYGYRLRTLAEHDDPHPHPE